MGNVKQIVAVLLSLTLIASLTGCVRLAAAGDTNTTTEATEQQPPSDPTDYEFWQALHPTTQPEGHEGLWFDEEPTDHYHRMLWKSQRFWGKPLQMDVFGDFEGKGGAEIGYDGLPRICEGEVVERLAEMGWREAADGPTDSPGGYTCGFYDPSLLFSGTRDLIGIVKLTAFLNIAWGPATLDDQDDLLEYSRGEFYREREFSHEFQCLAGFELRGKTVGALFWMTDTSDLANTEPQCMDSMLFEQTMYNVTNGFQDLLPGGPTT